MKSLYRSFLSSSLRIIFFYIFVFLSIGYLIFIFEVTGHSEKTQFFSETMLYSLIPIYALIFLKFLMIFTIGKDIETNLLLFFKPENNLLVFINSLIDPFIISKYVILYKRLKDKIKVKECFIIIILIPLFLLERNFYFVYSYNSGG